jgi:hypothetical protein
MAGTIALEKLLVQGQPIEGYRATDTLTGTKAGAALRDLPIGGAPCRGCRPRSPSVFPPSSSPAPPLQRRVLPEAAREFQARMRALFGAKLASMTLLIFADYDRTPIPPVLALPFPTRLHDSWPALALGLPLRRSGS